MFKLRCPTAKKIDRTLFESSNKKCHIWTTRKYFVTTEDISQTLLSIGIMSDCNVKCQTEQYLFLLFSASFFPSAHRDAHAKTDIRSSVQFVSKFITEHTTLQLPIATAVTYTWKCDLLGIIADLLTAQRTLFRGVSAAKRTGNSTTIPTKTFLYACARPTTNTATEIANASLALSHKLTMSPSQRSTAKCVQRAATAILLAVFHVIQP